MKLYQVTAVRKAYDGTNERVFLCSDGYWTTDRTAPGVCGGSLAEARLWAKGSTRMHTIPKDSTVEQWHKSRRANANRKAREQAMLDCGLVRGKTALGRDIWE